MSQNQVQYTKQSRRHPRRVFFTGSTALRRGQGLCYDRNYGTAADADERRDKYVELPASGNNKFFAGVANQDYSAKSAGQWIDINEPGSICEILAGVDTTVQATIMTCSASEGDPGFFTKAGFMGRGTARALQTTTAGVTGSSWDGTALVNDDDVSKTGLFAGAVAGDKLIIVTGADGVTPGEYTIATVTSDDAAVLSDSPSASSLAFVGYVIHGSSVVLAELMDGEQSGLIEVIAPIDNTAVQSMVGGVTYIMGGLTLGTGDSTATLADGTELYEKKGFWLLGALTTQDWLLTLTTAIQKDRSTDLNTLEFDAANDKAFLTWLGDNWLCDWMSGPTAA